MNNTRFCIILVLIFCVFWELKAQNNNDSIVSEEVFDEIRINEEAFRLAFERLNTQLPSWFFCPSNATYCGVSFPLADSIIAEQQAILMARMISALSQKEYNKIECNEDCYSEISDGHADGAYYNWCSMTLLLPSISSIKNSEILANASVAVCVECDFTKTDTLRVAWEEMIRDGLYSCNLRVSGRKEEMHFNEDNEKQFLYMWSLEQYEANNPYGGMIETNLPFPIVDKWANRNIYAHRNTTYNILHNIFQTLLDYYRWSKTSKFSVAFLWHYIPVDDTHFKLITYQKGE